MKHLKLFALPLILATAACAMNEYERVGFDRFTAWDVDDDGDIDRREWDLRFAEVTLFEDWDVNDDLFLDDTEWRAGTFDWNDEYGEWDAWDLDDDGRLNASEFSTGVFDTWDDDQNELISDVEFDVGLGGL